VKSRSLLAQVLAINLLLIAMIVLVATVVVDARAGSVVRGREIATLALAVVVTLVGNWLLLHRRFTALDELISAMESVDLAAPQGSRRRSRRNGSAEVRRLDAAFERMISRLESERRRAGRQAIRAQERERRRIAQDLHDEVNQALTAISLRLQATIERAPNELRRELLETKRLSGQAMEELLSLARTLRPAVLDDHGLVPALHSQVQDFREQTRIEASFTLSGPMLPLSPEQQLVIYRVTQESLSNVAQHSGARRVHVELSFVGRTVLCVTDDGKGFPDGSLERYRTGLDSPSHGGGLGLPGMRERALLIGGHLDISSHPGQGTRVQLTIGPEPAQSLVMLERPPDWEPVADERFSDDTSPMQRRAGCAS
jgi:two-component system, NarL family, sensor histidine kinase UhpB